MRLSSLRPARGQGRLQTPDAIKHLDIDIDLVKGQQLYFHIARRHYQARREQAETDDQSAREWVKRFDELGAILRVRRGA